MMELHDIGKWAEVSLFRVNLSLTNTPNISYALKTFRLNIEDGNSLSVGLGKENIYTDEDDFLYKNYILDTTIYLDGKMVSSTSFSVDFHSPNIVYTISIGKDDKVSLSENNISEF